MLRGNFPATVDNKGRLKIPAAFKTYLDENYGTEFYVTSLDGLSVRVYQSWSGVPSRTSSSPCRP